MLEGNGPQRRTGEEQSSGGGVKCQGVQGTAMNSVWPELGCRRGGPGAEERGSVQCRGGKDGIFL